MDEDFKRAIVDFYSPEELLSLLSPLSADCFLALLDALEEELTENIQEIKEEMRYDDGSD